MAEIIGGHRVFGHSMLWASVLTMFTPAASFIDYKALVVVRALLGLMLGTIDTVKLTLTLIASKLLIVIVCVSHFAIDRCIMASHTSNDSRMDSTSRSL